MTQNHQHQPARYLIQEVHNFGGFFGGDTVTLTAIRQPTGEGSDAPGEEQTLTIDERAFTNVRDRHTIAAGMLLALTQTGERVDQAELLGATSHAALRAALGPIRPVVPLDGPQVLSYHCETCNLWVAGAPESGACRLCGCPVDPRSHAKGREEDR